MNQITLFARDAQLLGGLRILDFPVMPAVHFWQRLEDKINWTFQIHYAGQYQVNMHYSFAPQMAGAVFTINVGESVLQYTPSVTSGWEDFRTFSAGQLRLEMTGKAKITLQAAKFATIPEASMPDIAWISLVACTN